MNRLFIGVVVIPTILAILYFGLFASDVYVSESRFVVRSPDKPAASGLGMILKSVGFSNAGEEGYAARSYVESRDALRQIDKDGLVSKAYGSPKVDLFDRFNPLGLNGTFEDLFDYYLGKVTVNEDAAASIATLTVRAYTPQDAQRINERLLTGAEKLVNQLNERGRKDLIQSAEREAVDAQIAARTAAMRLSAFRNSSQILDPERQAQIQMQMVSKLQDQLIVTRAQLTELQSVAPENPQVGALRQKIGLLEQEIARQSSAVAGAPSSLATKAARFQQLELESQFADKQLAGAMASLEDARNEARRKQAYVERIAMPNLPDDPTEPRRLRGIIATLIVGLLVYGILSMLIAGTREHRD